MTARVYPSIDVVKSLSAPVDYAENSIRVDAVMDAADILWVARTIPSGVPDKQPTQTEVSYSTRIYGSPLPVQATAGKVDGISPTWLKCPEGTIYLLCGGKSYQLDAVHRTLLNDTALTRLATIAPYWTWAWRGDELWIAGDLGGGGSGPGIGLTHTRDRGRTALANSQPTDSPAARHPRVVIARTGEIAIIWWEDEKLRGAISRDFDTWTKIPPFQAAKEQLVGALFLDQKLVVSFLAGDGTVQRIECDSVNGEPSWL